MPQGACLTAPGEGGLHVFRVVGDGAGVLLERVFRPANRGTGSLRYGHLVDGDDVIDEVIVTVDDGGRGFEVSTHGGSAMRDAVLGLLERVDVQLVPAADVAGPSGPIAREALEGLERSHGVHALLFFLAALQGGLAAEAHALSAVLEASDAEAPGTVLRRLDVLLGRAAFGRAFTLPPTLLLAGPPNAGKSTLANRLLGRDRCIVTDDAGTTRDLVGAPLSLAGYPLQLLDSAGVRTTSDPVERLGVQRTLAAGKAADVVVAVVDGSETWPSEPLVDRVLRRPGVVVCLNKADRGLAVDRQGLAQRLGRPVVVTSALEGTGIDTLVDAILFRTPFRGPATRDFTCPFTDRQVDCLERARAALSRDPAAARLALSDLLCF